MPLAGASQVTPQAPQFAMLVRVSTQVPSQAVNPESHVKPQLPALQLALPCSGTGQLTSQLPQCAGVLATSTQAPSQFCSPVAHTSEHCPPEQT